MERKAIITRTVWLLSLVSLFTDVGSEMLYPVMPVYLKSIGFSVVLIGILEGMAEAVAGLGKGYFGKVSDNLGRRLPFVQWGYFLSALSKPMMAVLTYPWWVFGARTLDRIGKGLRSGARDAMLSGETTPEHKGKVFGFHRAMDTTGAVIGPLLALIFLWFYPNEYKTLFFLAFIPGMLSVVITLFVKEKPSSKASKRDFRPFFFSYLRQSPQAYNRLIVGLLLFTLFNSSDAFLLLMIRQRGFSDTEVIGVYIFYNLIFALLSFPMGALADRIGFKNSLLIGLLFFVITYAGMAMNTDYYLFFVLFACYGMYAACTEGIAKAWLSNTCEKKDMATAMGVYAGLNSLVTMAASFMAGLIWHNVSPEATFYVSAAGAGLALLYFLVRKTGVVNQA